MINVIARNSIGGFMLDMTATVQEPNPWKEGTFVTKDVEMMGMRVPAHNVAQVAKAALTEAFQQNLMTDELRKFVIEMAALISAE